MTIPISDPARLTGYTPRLSFAAGDRVPLHISADEDVRIRLVRLHSSDPRDFEHVRSTAVTAPVQVAAPGIHELRPGSYGTAEVEATSAISCELWVYSTHPRAADSTIFSLQRAGSSLSLGLDGTGRLALLSGTEGALTSLSLGIGGLTRHRWQRLRLTVDAGTLSIENFTTDGTQRATSIGSSVARRLVSGPGPMTVTLAALGGELVSRFFDGKLDRPTIAGRELFFDPNQVSDEIRDAEGGVRGRLINAPTRAVTGHLWKDQTQNWQAAPELYTAAHFHSDDLVDAAWPVSATLELPPGLASGLYAAELTTDTHRDWLPFAVKAAGRASVTVLLPSFTWLAYANEAPFPPHEAVFSHPRDDYARKSGLVSLYDFHRDGSGVAYASVLRPLLNLRPDYCYWLTGYPHGPGADLSILDFLDHLSIDFDVITDHDLDRTPEILDDCSVLVTGCHPEYWSRSMMKGLERWLDVGGRFVYLGGNGLHAVVAPLHGFEHILELRRRGAEVGLWEAAPGEAAMAATGEIGGLWRHHFPTPSRITGMVYCTMGFADGVGYRLLAGAGDTRAHFIMTGLSAAELSGEDAIGAEGLWFGAAAAYECDRAGESTGMPPHALVLAQSDPLPGSYESADNSGIRQANLVFFETDAGGAVFSVGSIAWSGALAVDDFANTVATITGNVLRRFIDPAPFEVPRE